MKHLLIILALLALVRVSNSQPIPVTADTIYLDVKGIARPGSSFQLTHAIKSNGKYYCFFDESLRYSYGDTDKKHLLVMTEKGDDIKEIRIPEDIDNTVYFDFFVINDSIFVKIYHDRNCYYLDTNLLKWVEVREVDDIVYEDEQYKVTYLDFGEWGERTWFINKKTGTQHELDINSECTVKKDGRYYITNINSIVEIANPGLLRLCDETRYYENFKGKIPEEEISIVSGFRYVYTDSLMEHPLIKSIIMNNEFYQVYIDDSVSYVGRIINDSLVPVQKLEPASYYNWYYSYRGQNDKYKLLKFAESFNTYSLVSIDNNRIKVMHLIHNHDSLKLLGTDSFKEFLSALSANTGAVNKKVLFDYESSACGTDLKNNNLYLDFDSEHKFSKDDYQSQRFVKVINQYIAQTSEYVYNKHDDNVKFIRIDWCTTEPMVQGWDFLNDDKNNEAIKVFSQKKEEIIATITQVTGSKPYKTSKDRYGTDIYWKLPNGTIKLTYNKSFEIQEWIGLEITFN